MKPIFTLLLAIGLPIFSFGQIVPTTCEAPDSVKMLYEFDAKVFAVESMQGTPLEDSVIIPDWLIEAKLKLLAVHNGFGLAARDTVADCLNIHLDSFEHSLRHVRITADTGVVWFKNLANGISPTGNPAVDSLAGMFGMTVQEHFTWSFYRYILLMADQDYNTAAIAKKFTAQDSVIEAGNEPGSVCWGCDQIYQEFPFIDTFVILKYLHCWGDDCGYHRVWEFHLPLGCEEVEFAGSYNDVLPEGACDGLDAAGDFSVFEKFEVAPSPADDFCFLKITAQSNMHGRVYLLNLPGQILKSQEIKLEGGRETQTFFETSDLPTGLYFLTLKLDNQFFTKKIIIHHR